MEVPLSTLNNLSTYRANKSSVYDPVDKMTSDSSQIERTMGFHLCQLKFVVNRVKSLSQSYGYGHG